MSLIEILKRRLGATESIILIKLDEYFIRHCSSIGEVLQQGSIDTIVERVFQVMMESIE